MGWDIADSKDLWGDHQCPGYKVVSPTSGATQSLSFEQVRLASSQLFLGFLVLINVGQQVVPADNPSLSVAKRESARLEPAIHPVRPAANGAQFRMPSRLRANFATRPSRKEDHPDERHPSSPIVSTPRVFCRSNSGFVC